MTFQTSPSLSISFFSLPPRSDAERALSLARSMIALHFSAAPTPTHSWSLFQAFRAARLSENTVTQVSTLETLTFSFSFSSFFFLVLKGISRSIIHVPPAKATDGGGGGCPAQRVVWTGTDLCVSSNLSSAEQEVSLTSDCLSLVEG